MATDSSQQLNHKLTLRVASISLIVTVAGTIVRPLFIDLPVLFTWIGVLNTILVSTVYLIIKNNRFPAWEVSILLSAAMVSIFPLVFISGGVNSQYAVMLPLLPLLGGMLGGKRESVIIGLFLMIVVLVLTYYGDVIADFTDDVYFREKSYSRGLWLIFTLVISSYFGNLFQQKNRELTEMLASQATLDGLTGVANRRGFNQHFERETKNAQRAGSELSLIMVDIDFFKKINDEYGHDVGDSCLIGVAKTLKNNIRATDIVARFGGEEFILILPKTGLSSAMELAEKLRLKLTEQRFGKVQISLTATFGISTYSQQDNVDSLLKRADEALYRGKENGRNRVEVETLKTI